MTAAALRRGIQVKYCCIKVPNQTLCDWQETLTFECRRDSACCPLEQLQAYVVLELLNRQRDGWLRSGKLPGSELEATVSRDDYECSKMPQCDVQVLNCAASV